MQECIQCHHWCDGSCENPACPQDKEGAQLQAILEAEAAWLAKQHLEDLWRRDARRLYNPTR
jgi:hypothetical protein